MLNLNSVIGAATLAFLAWIGVSVVELKTDTAVIGVKVDQNHTMLVELWDYYLQERVNDNIAQVNIKTDLQAGG